MKTLTPIAAAILLVLCGMTSLSAASSAEAFLGSWAFQLPDGRPAWLQIVEADGQLQGALLWSVGSARPVKNLRFHDDEILFERKIRWQLYGNADDVRFIDEPMRGKVVGEQLRLTAIQHAANDERKELLELIGKRMPDLPPRPDLRRLALGDPIQLFNGRDLTGWQLADTNKKNGWHVENGELMNETPKKDFSAYGEYGNLRTDREFEDFQLTIEYNVAAGGNSGIYLRGMYEAQVVDRDSRMQGISGPGAIFGRIVPAANAGAAGAEWNRYELTLVDRHITVVLNGKKVIDNQPIVGCTGGGLSADDTQPGPVLLQGDHTSVRYRNIVLRPVVKSR